MLSTKDSPQKKRYTCSESEGMEKNIPCKWRSKKAEMAILSDNRFLKAIIRDKKKSLHNSQRFSPREYKYL